jgi:3-oxoacyl-[acyl-carrier protein] reductase
MFLDTVIIFGAGSSIAKKLIKKIKCNQIICISKHLKKKELPKKSKLFDDFNLHKIEIKKLIKRKKITTLFLNNFTVDNLILKKKKSELQKELNENIVNVFEYSKEISEIMIENNFGRLIYFSSSRGLSSDIGISGYSISKNGLLGLMKSFSKEFSRFNITSNCISLGFFDSPLFHKIDKNLKKKMLSRCTISELGDVESINNAINFISNSKYLTGSTLFLDGGYN